MTNELSGWYVASVVSPVYHGKSYQGWRPCIDWCRKHLGDRAIDGWRFQGEGVFEFREEKDYLMFLLRWV